MTKDTDFNPDELENGDVEIEINDWKNQPESNCLEKGRYPFKVLEVVNTNHVVPSTGNICFVVDIMVDGWKKIRCYLVKHDGNGKKTRGSHMYTNFLYAIGIRNQNKSFKVKLSQIVGGEGLCDVIVKSDGTDNYVQNFSAIEQPSAPINDVPSENETEETLKKESSKNEKPKEKKSEKHEENDDEDVDNL
jgi:hypothetical protein